MPEAPAASSAVPASSATDGSSACPIPTNANSTATEVNSPADEVSTKGAAAGGPSAIPALKAEPLTASSPGRRSRPQPATRYALLAGRYSAAPHDTRNSAPTATTGRVSPGTKAAKPAVRTASATSIVARSPIRAASTAPTTPPENCTSDATAKTAPTTPSPSPKRSWRSTDMYGSTAKLPSVMRNEAPRRKS